MRQETRKDIKEEVRAKGGKENQEKKTIKPTKVDKIIREKIYAAPNLNHKENSS